MECVAVFVFWADCDICLRQFASLVNPVSTHKADTVLSLRARDIVLCCDQQWWPVCFWRARRCFRAFVLYSTGNLTACYAHVLIFCALGGDINVGAFYFRTQLLLMDQLAKPFWYSHVAELRLAAAHDCFAAFHHCVARQTKVGIRYDHVLRAGASGVSLYKLDCVGKGQRSASSLIEKLSYSQMGFSEQNSFVPIQFVPKPPPQLLRLNSLLPQILQAQRIMPFCQPDVLFVAQQWAMKICWR